MFGDSGEQKMDFFFLFVSLFWFRFFVFLVKPCEWMNLEELKEAEGGSDETDRKAIDMYRFSGR